MCCVIIKNIVGLLLSYSTQPNPTHWKVQNLDTTRPDQTQPYPQVDPNHGQLCTKCWILSENLSRDGRDPSVYLVQIKHGYARLSTLPSSTVNRLVEPKHTAPSLTSKLCPSARQAAYLHVRISAKPWEIERNKGFNITSAVVAALQLTSLNQIICICCV